MTTIDNGNGPHRSASVNNYFQVETASVVESAERFYNKSIGKVWTILSNTTAVGAGDYILYIKNTGTDQLEISEIQALAGTATTLYIDEVTGTPSFTAGVDLTPLNRNIGSNNTITATIKEDTDTTGLTLLGSHLVQRLAVADTQYYQKPASRIIIPGGSAVAVRTTVAAQVEMMATVIASPAGSSFV